MPPSYRSVNYSLRPAKQIERRMLAEALLRLSEFAELASYRYIGLGGIHFKDFIVFHRLLGIHNMLSIEKEVQHEERFKFNRPFACVDMRFGNTVDELPTLQWDVRTILWLDYDDPLNRTALSDVGLFCSRATSGSVLIVTVQAQDDADEANPLENLQNEITPEKVPLGVTNADFAGWGTAALFRRIINNEVAERLQARNATRAVGARFKFKPLFYFNYRDGAKMLTVGGILYDEGQAQNVAKCGFENLEFARTGDDPYTIKIPVLTTRELRDLDRMLPGMTQDEIDAHPVPNSDVSSYARVYRFFPTFAEIEP